MFEMWHFFIKKTFLKNKLAKHIRDFATKIKKKENFNSGK